MSALAGRTPALPPLSFPRLLPPPTSRHPGRGRSVAPRRVTAGRRGSADRSPGPAAFSVAVPLARPRRLGVGARGGGRRDGGVRGAEGSARWGRLSGEPGLGRAGTKALLGPAGQSRGCDGYASSVVSCSSGGGGCGDEGILGDETSGTS